MLSALPGVKVLRSVISELISHRHELILLVANLLCPLSLVFEKIILVMSTDTVLKLTLFSCNCSDIFVRSFSCNVQNNFQLGLILLTSFFVYLVQALCTTVENFKCPSSEVW